MLALEQMVVEIRNEAVGYGSLGNVPAGHAGQRTQPDVSCERNASVFYRSYGPRIGSGRHQGNRELQGISGQVDDATFRTWVKVAVALALGLGTMVGWKRIVITVGGKIGKSHLTYAQGAAAEITAMVHDPGLADRLRPARLHHPCVKSSGVAGTMAANHSGLQLETIRNIAAAWVFTLPAAALLSGCLFWIFNTVSK